MSLNETPVDVNRGESAGGIQRRLFRIVLSVLLILAAVAATLAFRGLGRWLIREDALAPAGVIVVLSGGMPYRAEQAAAIYRMGYAREVWLTRPDSPAPELAEMGVTFYGEETYNREILTHSGVPAASVRILPDAIVDTEQEIREVAREMRREGWTKAIIVTSPQHTRRVRALWRLLAGSGQQLIVRAAWQDPFDADHWWRNTQDALSVVRETLGLINAWAGLPVRPHAP
jgi:uncharacterized SAM-binding protein YcdF (DUF218 family)